MHLLLVNGTWEYTIGTVGANNSTGIIPTASIRNTNPANFGFAEVTDARKRGSTAIQGNAAQLVTGLTSTATSGTVIGIAVDFDNGRMWSRVNGTWDLSGNPATNTSPTTTFTTGKEYYVMAQAYNTWSGELNTGQRPFAYAAPSGFKALCDTNLPTPTIAKGSSVFDTKLYTGNGSTQTISGLGFSPDLVWIKKRNTSDANDLFYVVRGSRKVVAIQQHWI